MRYLWIAAGLGCVIGCGHQTSLDAEREATSYQKHAAPAAAVPQEFVHAFDRPGNTESYDEIEENPFLTAVNAPTSTFSIDVDTASYSNVRRFLQQDQWPPAGAVRIEELINYFPYEYPPPTDEAPFAASVEMAGCPWEPSHRLARIALKGREIDKNARPVSNLVFLLDVSGSMADANKLPLVRSAIKMLVDNFRENDRVAIVVYAGASGLVLPSTTGDQKTEIFRALDRLYTGGGTNGGEGIELAYNVALENFISGGANRVILCTDGDFNVGITDRSRLVKLIEQKAASNIFLSVLGVGMGDYQDSLLEDLADKGNGNFAYIDSLNEARKVLIEQMSGTLITIAKDVKIQVEFNPAHVAGYRLIGYENRMLQTEDFRDDAKDAGEIGAGHAVTALYEIVPAGQAVPATAPAVSPEDSPSQPARDFGPVEILNVRLRYKNPEEHESRELQFPLQHSDKSFAEASPDFQFAAAVAEFGMLLRNSHFSGNATLQGIIEIARANRDWDPHGYRAEFIELVERARRLFPARQAAAL